MKRIYKPLMVGLLDTKGFEEAQRVWYGGGVAPTVKVGGDPIKILVEVDDEKDNSSNERQEP